MSASVHSREMKCRKGRAKVIVRSPDRKWKELWVEQGDSMTFPPMYWVEISKETEATVDFDEGEIIDYLAYVNKLRGFQK